MPARPRAVVLVLHGGASRQQGMMVSPAQLSVIRMIPIATDIARAGRGELAVFRLLNATRGWDTHHTPVDDVTWALHEVEAQFGPGPAVGLVGHSLGGRAALLAGAQARVRSVVALAPWVYPTDDADLSGRSVLIVHGAGDRVARPDRSAAVARSLGRRTGVGYVTVEHGRHAMLRRSSTFSGLAADFTAAVLLGRTPRGLVARALAGEQGLRA